MFASFLASVVFDVNVILIILVCAVIGLLATLHLSLIHIYQKNTSAIAFYHHCGFCILSEKTQSNQNFNEFLMEWRKKRRE